MKRRGPPPIITTGNPSAIADDIFDSADARTNAVKEAVDEAIKEQQRLHVLHMVQLIQGKLANLNVSLQELYSGLVNLHTKAIGFGDTAIYTDVVYAPPGEPFPDAYIGLSVTGPTPWVSVKELPWCKDKGEITFESIVQAFKITEHHFYHYDLRPGFATGFFYTGCFHCPLNTEHVMKLYNYLFRQD